MAKKKAMVSIPNHPSVREHLTDPIEKHGQHGLLYLTSQQALAKFPVMHQKLEESGHLGSWTNGWNRYKARKKAEYGMPNKSPPQSPVRGRAASKSVVKTPTASEKQAPSMEAKNRAPPKSILKTPTAAKPVKNKRFPLKSILKTPTALKPKKSAPSAEVSSNEPSPVSSTDSSSPEITAGSSKLSPPTRAANLVNSGIAKLTRSATKSAKKRAKERVSRNDAVQRREEAERERAHEAEREVDKHMFDKSMEAITSVASVIASSGNAARPPVNLDSDDLLSDDSSDGDVVEILEDENKKPAGKSAKSISFADSDSSGVSDDSSVDTGAVSSRGRRAGTRTTRGSAAATAPAVASGKKMSRADKEMIKDRLAEENGMVRTKNGRLVKKNN